MEWIIRTGADKRKAKLIEELRKDNTNKDDEIKNLKLDLILANAKVNKLEKRIKYLEKKVGNKNGKVIK